MLWFRTKVERVLRGYKWWKSILAEILGSSLENTRIRSFCQTLRQKGKEDKAKPPNKKNKTKSKHLYIDHKDKNTKARPDPLLPTQKPKKVESKLLLKILYLNYYFKTKLLLLTSKVTKKVNTEINIYYWDRKWRRHVKMTKTILYKQRKHHLFNFQCCSAWPRGEKGRNPLRSFQIS